MISTVGTALVLSFGSYWTLRRQMSVGTLVAFVSYLTAFYAPVTQLIQVNNTLQHGRRAERVFQFMDEVVDIEEEKGAVPLGQCRGEVALDHVWFSYTPGTPVLKDVTVHASPGRWSRWSAIPAPGKRRLSTSFRVSTTPTRGRCALTART